MAVSFDKSQAAALLRAEASAAERGEVLDATWQSEVERLSELCEEPGSSRTHIAFLCTTMLAKSLRAKVDLNAIKPTHAGGNDQAYSARSLCHAVVVPLSEELGFNIGVTGREPLNNQPYFRMKRLGDGTPVRNKAKDAFDHMIRLVDELNHSTPEAARKALRALIFVRRRYQISYATGMETPTISPTRLADAIQRFVAENSEGGKRAQAIVAALFDVAMGDKRVESGRINDPSRNFPGDVCIRSVAGGNWEKAVEVRD